MEYGIQRHERETFEIPASFREPGVVSVLQERRKGIETLTFRDGHKEVRVLNQTAPAVSPGRTHHVPATSRVLGSQPRTRRQARAEIARAEARLDPASRVALLEARYPEAKTAKPTLFWDGRDRENWDPMIWQTDYDREQLLAQRQAKVRSQKAEIIDLKARMENRRKDRWVA